jgi:hypothetical protein
MKACWSGGGLEGSHLIDRMTFTNLIQDIPSGFLLLIG